MSVLLIARQALTFQSFSFAYPEVLLCFTDILHTPCAVSLVILGLSWIRNSLSTRIRLLPLTLLSIHTVLSETYNWVFWQLNDVYLFSAGWYFTFISMFLHTGLLTFEFIPLVLLLSARGHCCLPAWFEKIICLILSASNWV